MRASDVTRSVSITAILTFAASGCGGSDGANASNSAVGGNGNATIGGASIARGIGGALLGGTTASGGRQDSLGTSAEGGTAHAGGGSAAPSSSWNRASGGTVGSTVHGIGGVRAVGGSSALGTTSGGSVKGSSGGAATNGGTAAAGTMSSGGAAANGGMATAGTKVSGGAGNGSTITAGATATAGTGSGGTPQICAAGQAQPTAGNRRMSLSHGGKSRSYILHVPSRVPSGKPLALVLDLHGAGSSGSGQQSQSGWGTTADREGFLVVYPDGIDGYWNVDDKCCGTAGSQKIDDVGFLKAIILALGKEACIDKSRIYVTGFSNGGGLTHRMGCDAADVIAAIAPVDTDLRTQPCNAARPISMMEFRGTGDSLEPYEGGLVGPEGGQYVAVGAKASLKLWADLNHCTGTSATFDKYCEGYTACMGDVETDLCSLPGVDHGAYRNNLNFNISDTAWKMFQRQPMR